MRSDLMRPAGKEPLNFAQLRALSDEALMEHLCGGHDDALAVLFDRYHRLVLRIAGRILRDRGEAEDLMQSVFFEIYRIKEQFEPQKGTVRTWLLQYAYHRCLNRWHYLKARGLDYHAYTTEAGEPATSRATAFDRTLNSVDAKLFVRQGLASLTVAQRKCLEMSFFEGLSNQEIAAQMEESVSNVRHHYYRGLQVLRSVLIDKAGRKSTTG